MLSLGNKKKNLKNLKVNGWLVNLLNWWWTNGIVRCEVTQNKIYCSGIL